MNIIEFFQNLASHVPELLQPLIIALAGAVPFVEGELSAVIGVWAGLNPIIAGIAGAIGNFACVTVIVLLGALARKAVVNRRRRTPEAVPVGAGGIGEGTAAVEEERFLEEPPAEKKPDSKGRIRPSSSAPV